MNTCLSKKRISKRMFLHILSIVVILALAFPATGSVDAQEPVPYIEAFAWFDRFSLVDWPAGVPVQITIQAPSYEETFTPEASPHRYDFFPGVDLQAGTIIVATNGETTKSLTLSPLRATADAESGIVTGIASHNSTFHMKADGDRFQLPIELDIDSDESGGWSVTFDDYLPWEWFTRGEMWEGDEDGDITYAIWHVHQPVIEVWLAQNEIHAFDWPVDSRLTFLIDDQTIASEVMAEPVDWMESTSVSINVGDLGVTLAPNMTVAVTDGNSTKTTIVQDLIISAIDIENDIVYGTAPENAELELGSWEDSPVFRFFNNGNDSNWMIDYQQPSLNNVTVDLNPGDELRLFMRDDDKDSTVWQSFASDARVYANVTEDGIRFEYSPPGAWVTFSIYDSPDGNLLWEDGRLADDFGFTYVGIWDHRVDLKPGYYISVSDGTTTKRLRVETVSLDLFDPVENMLQGTAFPDRTVWVVANNESIFCGTEVRADPDGNWVVDFDDYTCDVAEDMWAYAQAIDAEGDTTEAVMDFIEGYHDYNAGDVPSMACNAGGWVVDTDDRERDLAIRILADGNEVTSLTAENPREDLLGACGADGSCAFEVNLWGLISPYEEHQITTQAYDEETGQWFDLNDTSRKLTCRTYDIYAYNPLTGTTQQITNLREVDEYDPTWSPNGKKVAHDVVTGGEQMIYVTDLKTGVSTPLIGAENGGNDASWSPNGKWIAFDRRWVGEPSIYIVPAAGGAPSLVTEDAALVDWAPNSKRLVYERLSDGSIHTVAIDGGKGGPTDVVGSGSEPVWSPDGNWIAYVLDGNIWKVKVNILGNVLDDPIQVTQLTGWNVGGPSWSLDSQSISFNGSFGDDFDIWRVPGAGGELVWLTGAPAYGDYGPENAWNNTNIAYASPSPNGQAPRTWVAAFTYDLPAGYWTEGNHTYHFEAAGLDNTPDLSFDVGSDKRLYDGTALLRPWSVIGRMGEECLDINAIHPNQPTKFYVGWTADGTYSDALTYYENLMAKVAWDGNDPVDIVRHEIFPITPPVDWFGYTCSFTSGPPAPRVTVQITDDWLRAENFTPNGQVTFWLYDAEDNLLAHPESTWQLDGSGYITIGMWELEEYIDLIPGYRLVVSDGIFTKSIVLEDLHFDAINLATGQLWGTAPEPYGRNVWVGIGWENDGWFMDVNTDASSSWIVDFNQSIPGDCWWVAAQIFDQDGDASEVRPSDIINWTLVITNQPDWVSSGIPVSAGQSFTIEAIGSMNPCSDTYPNGADYCIFYTPLGAEGVVSDANEFGIFPGPGLRFMGLLGRIGEGAPFYVGAGGTFTATESGTLWFTPNDNLRTDNQGAYSILVQLAP